MVCDSNTRWLLGSLVSGATLKHLSKFGPPSNSTPINREPLSEIRGVVRCFFVLLQLDKPKQQTNTLTVDM